MDAIDQRMFYLMLSPTEGQTYADIMGFAPPSEEVQEMEIMDVMTRWLTLHRTGTLEDIAESVEWFVTFLKTADKISSPPEEFSSALTVFSAAMLNRMMDSGKLGLFLNPEDLEDEDE